MHEADTSATDPHPRRLSLLVFPGELSSAQLLEEDDVSMRFVQRRDGNELRIEISPEGGSDRVADIGTRSVSLVLRGYAPPQETAPPLVSDVSDRSGALLEALPVPPHGVDWVSARWDGEPSLMPLHRKAERVRLLLLALDMKDTVKRTVGRRLDEEWSLEALRGVVEEMRPSQARALAETIAGRAFEDVLLS